jgi:hypothetical protein
MQSKQETSFLTDLSTAEITAINGGFSASSSSRASVSITAEEAANAPGGAIAKFASSENGVTTNETFFGDKALAEYQVRAARTFPTSPAFRDFSSFSSFRTNIRR